MDRFLLPYPAEPSPHARVVVPPGTTSVHLRVDAEAPVPHPHLLNALLRAYMEAHQRKGR